MIINDEDLLLYYYRELDAAEQARIGAALAEEPELARRLHALVAKLDAAAALPEGPVPEPAQQRRRAALEQAMSTSTAATLRVQRGRPSSLRWQLATAAAVVAALAYGILKMMPTPVTPSPPPLANTAAESSAYENGLKFHLASTERRLA